MNKRMKDVRKKRERIKRQRKEQKASAYFQFNQL